MITSYLIHWSASLLVLLLVYWLLLARQPLPRLKRAYLLAALLVPVVAPLLKVELPVAHALTGFAIPYEPLDVAPLLTDRPVMMPVAAAVADLPTQASQTPQNATRLPYWLWVYGLGTLLMLGRFGRNLLQLARQVRRHPSKPFRGARLVLLPGAVAPHTFGRYLFVSEAEWQQGRIEPQLLTHELAHIRQQHSLDVLLAEALLCFGWFNPLLFWLKRLMQFNHECLADRAVVGKGSAGDVRTYQHLLLDRLTQVQALPALASTLTFQTTKQRLQMMTKQTTPARAWLIGGSAALLFCALTLALVDTAPAQNAPAQNVPVQKKPAPVTRTNYALQEPRQLSAEEVKKKFGDDVFYGPDRKKTPVAVKKKVDSLLAAGQKVRVYFPPPLRIELTEAQWEDFKNTKKYGIWVDGKRRRDNPLSKYKRTDIVYYDCSYVHKNARQPEGYLYQLDLCTEVGYQKMLKDAEADPLMVIEPDRLKAKK